MKEPANIFQLGTGFNDMRHKFAIRRSLFALPSSGRTFAAFRLYRSLWCWPWRTRGRYHRHNRYEERKARSEKRVTDSLAFAEGEQVKLAMRIAVFALGAWLLFFGLQRDPRRGKS